MCCRFELVGIGGGSCSVVGLGGSGRVWYLRRGRSSSPLVCVLRNVRWVCVIIWPEKTFFLSSARRRFSRSPVLVRRIPPGCDILVGSVLVRVRGGKGGITLSWFVGRSMRSLCARLSWLRVVRRFGCRCGLGISAFSSPPIRWSTCMAFMVQFMGLRVHCWYWSVSCRRVTTHVVLRACIVIPGFCNRT